MRRLLPLVVGLLLLPAFQLASATAAPPPPCTSRVLVLASLPAEVDPLLAATKLEAHQPVTRSGRHFFLGKLAGTNVIVGMVGTGLVQAKQMTQAAFDGFRCAGKPGITAVVYSGVAGAGKGSAIGDVTVPRRWTIDNGKTFVKADPAMLAVEQTVVRRAATRLERTTPHGSPGCACPNPDLVRTVTFPYQPRILIGGDAQSYDNFGGKAFPCVPGGGDIFGCEPCPYATGSVSDVGRAVHDAVPLINPAFIFANLGPAAAPSEKSYVASDNETAAAAVVAQQHKAPFLAFRAISDGTPDPLHLPGYPSQFFVYYQLAAENAALAARTFVGAFGAHAA